MQERWRRVVLDNKQWPYEVSDLGRVRNINRNRLKIPSKNHAGALFVRLNMNGKTKTVFIHRLVASAFIGDQPKGYEINHKDGNKENNLPDNLEWVTHRQNLIHACRTGLKKPCYGERNGMTRLTERSVTMIKNLLDSGITQESIAKKFSVSRSAIKAIAEKRSWKWLLSASVDQTVD